MTMMMIAAIFSAVSSEFILTFSVVWKINRTPNASSLRNISFPLFFTCNNVSYYSCCFALCFHCLCVRCTQEIQADVKEHKELMTELDKTGTHLKYFSQKQDVVLVKNLLSGVQHRWDKLLLSVAERDRLLDHADREARQFRDSWSAFDAWLNSTEQTLDADMATPLSTIDPEAIRAQIARHKEFQRALGAKQSVLDAVNRAGRSLRDRCSKTDAAEIQDMMSKMKNKWNNMCGKSVDR